MNLVINPNTNLNGTFVRLKKGAIEELRNRGWDRGVVVNDGDFGIVEFEFGNGTPDHHIAVRIAGDVVGFPPECLEYGRVCGNF